MKVPLSWLNEFIPTKLSLEELCDTLTNIGLEVEGVKDSVLEISLTPNLSHCASVRGIARELAAVTQEPMHLPKFSVVEKGSDPIQKHASLVVEDQESAPRYACRLIQGVHVGPSPAWLKERIEQCGMRSVNNVVDITNLVLLEFGHPLHAFDFSKIEGGKVFVRKAKSGESILAIDGKEYFPTEETLLICDVRRPLALAGIMGGAESEVSDQTTSILLEAAYFEPTSIRRAAKRLGLKTEASYRFERGADPNGVIEALERAVSWICDLAGGIACVGMLECKAHEFSPFTVSCRLSRINKLLGTQLAMGEVETLYRRLHFQIKSIHEDEITVGVPTYRHDVRQEIDLVEEAARMYGFDNIHKREKAFYRTGNLPHSAEYLFEKRVRSRLIAEGLQEFLTCDLISPEQAALISKDNFPSRTLIKLLNPQSSEQSIMRPSLLPGMLSVVKYNADHGIHSLAGFEAGRVHFTSKDKYFEPPVVSIVLTGEVGKPHWQTKGSFYDFFDLKGVIINMFSGLKLPSPHFKKSSYSNFHPGRQAVIFIENREVGIMGEVHPLTCKLADVEQSVLFAELNLDDLKNFVKADTKMRPLPQYPASARDWTVTVPLVFEVGKIEEWIEAERSDLLEDFSLLDLYRSDKLGSDRKNITFRFVYRDRNKTISQSDVEKEHLRITNMINEHLK